MVRKLNSFPLRVDKNYYFLFLVTYASKFDFRKDLCALFTSLPYKIIVNLYSVFTQMKLFAAISTLVNLGDSKTLYTTSNTCYASCLKKDKNYCSSSSLTSGYCYDEDEDERRYNRCSFDTSPNTWNSMKAIVCPNEDHCYGGKDDKEFKVAINGDKTDIYQVSNDDAKDDFIKGDVCGYIISGPSRAANGDYLKIKLYEIKNANAYIHWGDKFDAETAETKTKMKVGTTYTIEYPNDAYITIFAQKVLFGKFFISAWF
jgi:hypothetical protein